MNKYGLRWTEAAGRDGRLSVKEKTFRTRTARDHWADLVAEKPTFVRFDAWLDLPLARLGRKVRVISREEFQRRFPGGHGRFHAEYAGCEGEILKVYEAENRVCYDLLFADLDGVIWADCCRDFFTLED